MIVKVKRKPKYIKIDSAKYPYNTNIKISRLERYNISIGQFDGYIEDILETWLEDQVRLFIHTNKEVPQELEELLAKEKAKEYIKKQKKYKKEDYDFFGILKNSD